MMNGKYVSFYRKAYAQEKKNEKQKFGQQEKAFIVFYISYKVSYAEKFSTSSFVDEFTHFEVSCTKFVWF